LHLWEIWVDLTLIWVSCKADVALDRYDPELNSNAVMRTSIIEFYVRPILSNLPQVTELVENFNKCKSCKIFGLIAYGVLAFSLSTLDEVGLLGCNAV
jgi:hypothetical protein